MMRIDLISHTPEEVVLRVSGELAGPEVAVLQEEGERWLAQTARLVLDLSYVQSLNVDGMALLYRWARQGAPVELRSLKPDLAGWVEVCFDLWDQHGQAPEPPRSA
jgi:ABC-type transporter Mla MlaB component